MTSMEKIVGEKKHLQFEKMWWQKVEEEDGKGVIAIWPINKIEKRFVQARQRYLS